ELGGEPSFKGYTPYGYKKPYPAALCTSVNAVVVHGLPSDYQMKEGDIVGLDLGMIYNGLFTDMAVTVPVGEVSEEALRLIEVTQKALGVGIKEVKPGNHIGDIGAAIQEFVEAQGLNVVRDLVGHGVGKKVHEEPYVPNYGKRGEGPIIREGMVLALEPMVVAGDWELEIASDGYGYETKDKRLAAHFEHTVAAMGDSPEVVTMVQ
ncbi:type I methionyl aminopeptidase, partial [Candidatus Azambacteria bacterium]|nr:type I methionyl aminopeptidase [Candidatus Azambacteria bacterium]